jgi:hypothetical protein
MPRKIIRVRFPRPRRKSKYPKTENKTAPNKWLMELTGSWKPGR